MTALAFPLHGHVNLAHILYRMGNMESMPASAEKRGGIYRVTKAYLWLLITLFALSPLSGVWYLETYQTPLLCVTDHTAHHFSIALSIALGLFVAYVTRQCYLESGEPLLRWLTFGFFGFALIYAPHGLFTTFSDSHSALFLLYGPASRFIMLLMMFVGLQVYGQGADEPVVRRSVRPWWLGMAMFFLFDLVIAVVAETALLKLVDWRGVFESGALVLALLGVVIVIVRHRTSPLMMTYALSMVLFAQSSFAFLLAKPWNHLWWYGHALFAAGFFILSYGVLRAFHSTGAFASVYSEEELMSRLRSEKSNTETALGRLQEAHEKLAWIASVDALTGAANRRHFMECIDLEAGRSRRSGAALSLLAMDIDHFKDVNDSHGHQAGDKVLHHFAERVMRDLRPHDIFGRIGGEEFMVLLPDTDGEAASILAERIRKQVEVMSIVHGEKTLHVTVSVGVAAFGRDGETVDQVIKVADERLYRAKHEGRNRVIS